MLRFLTTAAVAAICSIASAQDGGSQPSPSLSLGDKAPKIVLSKVVKGDFDGKFVNDKVYVVEFWATWCGPCKTSMPHLSELQKMYKDKGVTIIGVSDETEKKVADFIEKGDWPQKTQYVIAVDDDKKTSKAYMRAAGQNGIPTAFIVGKTGLVEWIGHPMNMDKPLAEIVSGDWNIETAKAEMAKERANEKIMQAANQKMSAAYQAQNWDELMKIMDELMTKVPADMVPQLQMQQFSIMAGAANQPERAYKIADQIIAKHADDMPLMNALAWMIATDPRITDRNLGIALKAALAGVKASDGKDGDMLDTLATVQGKLGKFEEAIKTEEKALKMTDDADKLAEFNAKIAEWKAEMASTG
jgi:thiol-disulfide isomerase/thioredoxin